jgi:hypothetical protein
VAAKKRKPFTEAVRPARLEVARGNQRWTEIEDDLVPRGHGWLVSAETDAIYMPTHGIVFQPCSVNVIADQTELSYFVDRDGDLVFLERVTNPATWSKYATMAGSMPRSDSTGLFRAVG